MKEIALLERKKVSTFHTWPKANTKPNIWTAGKVKKTNEKIRRKTWEQSQQSTVTKRIWNRRSCGTDTRTVLRQPLNNWGHKTDQQWTKCARQSLSSSVVVLSSVTERDHLKVTISYSKVSRCLAIMVITRDSLGAYLHFSHTLWPPSVDWLTDWLCDWL